MLETLKNGLLTAALVAAIAVVGCDNNDTTTTVDPAVDDTRTADSAVRDTGDAIGDAARETGNVAADAVRDTGDAARRGMDDAQTAAARTGTAATRPAEGLIGENVANASEKQFILTAASAGMFEVKSSELAQDKAANDPKVKEFAERMIEEHGQNNDELKRIATRLNINVPSDLMPQHQQLLDQLNQASDDQFAQRYHQIQQQAHQQSIQLFQQAQNTVQTQELKQYVQKTLPILQAHMQALQAHQH